MYVWINDDTGIPFYVGKGTGRRYLEKYPKTRNKWFVHIYNKHNTHSEIIIDNLSEEDAYKKERELELYYRAKGIKLCNVVDCGFGPPHGFGENNGNYGNRWTEERKRMASEYFIRTKSHSGARNGRSVKCMRVEDGKIYGYMTEAAKDVNAKSLLSISRCIKTKRFVCRGYHYVGEDMFEALNTEEKRKEYLNNLYNSPITQ